MSAPEDSPGGAPRSPAPRHTHRVRVTSSRRDAPAARVRAPAEALVEQTGLGELYLTGLLRAQLRLTLTVLAMGAAALLGLPALFALLPASRELSIAAVPVPWLVLGVLLYPSMVGVAWWYSRSATRLERRFTELVTRSGE